MDEDLTGPAPEALSRRQRRLVWAATVLVAATRLAVASRSLWDWDEALFVHAMRDYDVAEHRPHPPGFPLFIALAKLVQPLAGSELRALQAVSLLGAAALFPLMFAFARELRLPFRSAFLSALLLAFLPNVWFYGGTAFSDVPSLALVLLACFLLLRGCRSGGAYVAGAFVLAVAAGFRPQNLLVGLVPFTIATWMRIRVTRSALQPLLATAVGAATLLAAFGGAAMATGWERYQEAVSAHGRYIDAIDSFRSPIRPPLMKVADDFFLRPWRMPALNWAVSVLSAIGIVAGLLRRRRAMVLGLLTFGPLSLLGWLMLDFHSASRFSIGWVPLVALACIEGASLAAELAGRARTVVETAIPLALIAAMAVWTIPGLAIVRGTDSPPVRAVRWIEHDLPADARLYVHGSMGPFSRLLLGDRPFETYMGEWPLVWPDERNAWVLREGKIGGPGVRRFAYPREPLWNIARRRYFEVSVAPFCPPVRFGPEWHGEERAGGESFRWMPGRASLLLMPIGRGDAELVLRGHLPLDAMPGPPTVTITLDGKALDRFTATEAGVERRYVVARSDEPHRLVIETDRVFHDPRDLGFRLDFVSWSTAGTRSSAGTTSSPACPPSSAR